MIVIDENVLCAFYVCNLMKSKLFFSQNKKSNQKCKQKTVTIKRREYDEKAIKHVNKRKPKLFNTKTTTFFSPPFLSDTVVIVISVVSMSRSGHFNLIWIHHFRDSHFHFYFISLAFSLLIFILSVEIFCFGVLLFFNQIKWNGKYCLWLSKKLSTVAVAKK